MFHTIKAIRDKIFRWKLPEEKKTLKDSWGYIHYHVKLLHKSCTEESFLSLWNLIEKDWKDKYPENFLKYFKKNFIDNRRKLDWIRKDLIGLNFTNNGLEKVHGDIKQNYTERKKLALNEFIVKCMKKFLRDYSLDHQDNFGAEIRFTDEVWKKALHLLKDHSRGPFLDIINNQAFFIKKKRKLELFEERKEVNFINYFISILELFDTSRCKY